MSADRFECLNKALDVVGVRDDNYGGPSENFERIAALWNTMPNMDEHPMDSSGVALFMILVKVARLMHDPTHADSWIDIAGYAGCGYEVTQCSTSTFSV